jgi:1,4-dihydroxy-2-naphthoate polyprenyltransferase
MTPHADCPQAMGSSLKIWVHSARPKTLPAAVAPVLIGAGMAFHDGGVDALVFLAILGATLCIQIGTNYANDYFDFIKGADTADRVGPVRATAAGLVSPRQMLAATVIVFGVAALLGLYLVCVGGWPILVIGLVSMVCGVLYTAGPYALGYMGLGDLFVLVFFGPVAVGGTYYLLRAALNPPVLVAGLAPGLISCAILAVNNYRDRYTDKDSGKRTLVVRWGEDFGRLEYVLCLVLGCSLPVWLVLMTRGHMASLIALLSAVLAIPLIRQMFAAPDAQTLNRMLAHTGKLLILYSVLFTIGWNL